MQQLNNRQDKSDSSNFAASILEKSALLTESLGERNTHIGPWEHCVRMFETLVNARAVLLDLRCDL